LPQVPQLFLHRGDRTRIARWSSRDAARAGVPLSGGPAGPGETVRRRSDDTRTDLTPQEEEIAQLARDGRTNSKIAAQLFIGRRTVEWHLGKVFAKLDISSRLELDQALRKRSIRS